MEVNCQMELFRGAAVSPAARPRSNSAAAHEHVEASGLAESQRETVAWVLAGHPGKTASELAREGASEGYGLDRYDFGRRLPELAAEGRARKGYSRPCTVTGRQAATWQPVLAGRTEETA